MLVHSVILLLTLTCKHCIFYCLGVFLDEELGFEENTEFLPKTTRWQNQFQVVCPSWSHTPGLFDSPSVLFLYKISRCLHMITDDNINKGYTVWNSSASKLEIFRDPLMSQEAPSWSSHCDQTFNIRLILNFKSSMLKSGTLFLVVSAQSALCFRCQCLEMFRLLQFYHHRGNFVELLGNGASSLCAGNFPQCPCQKRTMSSAYEAKWKEFAKEPIQSCVLGNHLLYGTSFMLR